MSDSVRATVVTEHGVTAQVLLHRDGRYELEKVLRKSQSGFSAALQALAQPDEHGRLPVGEGGRITLGGDE